MKFPKINCFVPYFEFKDYSKHNDWFEFRLTWCNHLLFVLSLLGYRFVIGIILCKNKVAQQNVE